jgi:LPS sulfotransferase NodH
MQTNMARRFRDSRIGDFIRWKLEWKKIRKFSLNYFFSLFGGRKYAKFIVLTRSRTGSNLLVDYLNSHANVFCRSEIFRRLEGREWPAVLRSVYRRQPFFARAVGFKIFYGHPLDDTECGLWDALQKDRSIRVIHLVRNNVLRSVVSHRIADKTNFWFHKGKRGSPQVGSRDKKIRLDPDSLLEEFERTALWRLQGEARFRDHEMLEISYEDLTRDPEATFIRVCDFLAVPRRRPASSFKKQNPEKLSDLIENHAELEERFRGSRWREYFTEE